MLANNSSSFSSLSSSLTLGSGTVLKNRLVKASMNEALATAEGGSSKWFLPLYQRWAQGGCALLITGNIMVDRRHSNEPLALAVEDERDMAQLKDWAATGREYGISIWPQLNHPGKQSPAFLNKQPVAPSAVALSSDMFVPPKVLEHDEILSIIQRFIRSATILCQAGFDGVQLHAAHGYLISQFLSPRHNQRTDCWGGSLENRLRFLREIIQGIRAANSRSFNISVKLNSSDFQKGGFNEGESIIVAKALEELGIDLLEISGGSWEKPVNRVGTGSIKTAKKSTQNREAYFLDYAERLRREVNIPLMVTGGFRSQQAMESALKSGAIDVIGLARPVVLDPDFANKLLAGSNIVSAVKPITTGIKKVDDMAIMEISWYTNQIHNLSRGKKTARRVYGIFSVVNTLFQFWRRGQKVKKVRL